MRMPLTRTTLARVSCILSGTTTVFGLTALFSNNWVESENIHAGLLSSCSGGFCMSTLSTVPENFKPAFIAAMVFLIFMPLVLISVAAVLQGVTVWKGPSKRRDVSGLVLSWLSGYHSLLLTVLLIAAASMIPAAHDTAPSPQYEDFTFTTARPALYDENDVMYHDRSDSSGRYQYGGMSLNVGWSAYVGLLAAILALASAVSSSLYFGMTEEEDNDDNIPLEANAV